MRNSKIRERHAFAASGRERRVALEACASLPFACAYCSSSDRRFALVGAASGWKIGAMRWKLWAARWKLWAWRARRGRMSPEESLANSCLEGSFSERLRKYVDCNDENHDWFCVFRDKWGRETGTERYSPQRYTYSTLKNTSFFSWRCDRCGETAISCGEMASL